LEKKKPSVRWVKRSKLGTHEGTLPHIQNGRRELTTQNLWGRNSFDGPKLLQPEGKKRKR